MEIYDAAEILQMEAEKLKTIIHTENPDKCRLCLKVIKNRIIITNAIRKKFLDVTQTELPTSDKLSKFVCPKCDKDLKDAHSYRDKLIETQKKLCEEVGENRVIFLPEVVHLKEEKEDLIIEEDYDNDDFAGADDYSDCDDVDDDDFEPLIATKESVKDSTTNKLKEVTKSPKVQHKPRTRSTKPEENSQDSNEDIKPQQKGKTRSKNQNKGRRKRQYDYYDPELDIEVQQRKVTEENGRSYYLCSYCGEFEEKLSNLKL
jgi:predicted RNA-binding Zn-ribbon protein involved in translation (DUF1610 family)